MVEVYYYLPADELENAVECGLKLSRWSDKEVQLEGVNKKCISALLNPRDDMEKYRSEEFKCVKMEILPKYCFVADRYLYQVGLRNAEIMDLYTKSIIPVENYSFGIYRLPECLVTSTVIAEQVTMFGRGLDSPILFNSSEELYINNIIETYRDQHDDFNDTMLYCFYSQLADKGGLSVFEDNESGIAIFTDKSSGRALTLKIPDLTRYL